MMLEVRLLDFIGFHFAKLRNWPSFFLIKLSSMLHFAGHCCSFLFSGLVACSHNCTIFVTLAMGFCKGCISTFSSFNRTHLVIYAPCFALIQMIQQWLNIPSSDILVCYPWSLYQILYSVCSLLVCIENSRFFIFYFLCLRFLFW